MTRPYIHVSPRLLVREATGFDNQQGVQYQEVGGEHALWAARVPFVPALVSEDLIRLGRSRIALIHQRQSRFVYDLARNREHRSTFDLRYIATPNPVPGQPNLIDIVFLGKVFATRRGGAKALAEDLWERFVSNFPLEDPFNYSLEPVTEPAEFARYHEPLVLSALRADQVLEIRKYEEMPVRSSAPLARVARKGDYIAHPFVPTQEFNPMGRFLVALAAQPQPCFASVSIRPTPMFDQEVYNVSFAIGQFKRTAAEDDDVTEEYIRSRANVGIYVYQQLMEEREQLVTVRVHVVGAHTAPVGLAEALGSEMMGNFKNVYPTQWSAVQPANDAELQTTVTNLRWLEHEVWGASLASAPMARLRYLATPQEASGAFRLPVPPESGYLPGVLVKDEPFVAPADELELRMQARANLNDVQQELAQAARERKVSIGVVYHRGNPTSQHFRVNVRDLTRHALIAGSTGSGKSTTIKHLLAQLWQDHHVPFMVLYPIDKPDYRELRGFPRLADDLLIFTLGDDSTSPFRFNPFEVPEGFLIKTHLSRLMRVFMAAFTLQEPLPMIYRDALRQVYRQKGWDTVRGRGHASGEYPIMSEFLEAIQRITDSLKYGREVQDNVRQASVIRIADLLENAGYVVNVRQSISLHRILNQPTVMEIGRVGSVQDTSLLMGFLLMRFAEEVERHPRKETPHITVVEEAHRLMAETGGAGDSRGSAGEDFSNILAEVRGYGEGIIIAEQIPTLLVKGAIGNTYLKIMHWLEDAPSFDLFSSVMNLAAQQREYARSLNPGFAIVRSPYGRPVHLKVPEFGDQPGFDRGALADISDERTRDYMTEQRRKLKLGDVPVIPWQTTLSARGGEPLAEASGGKPAASGSETGWRAPPEALGFLLAAPMHTCLFCRPLHATRQCLYGPTVRNRFLGDDEARAQARQEFQTALTEPEPSRWTLVAHMGQAVVAALADRSPADQRGAVYCYLAHLADEHLRATRGQAAPEIAAGRKAARTLLQHFEVKFSTKKHLPAG